MAVAFRSASTGTTGNGTSHAIAYPSGVAASDVLIMIVHLWRPAPAVSPGTPSGWTKQADNTFSNSQDSVTVFTKVADGSETGTLTLTTSSAAYGNLGMLAYSGGAGVDAFTDYGSQQSGATPTVPSVTTTVANDMIVGLVGLDSGSSGTAASGWTERLDHTEANTSSLVYAMEKTQASAGASPTATPTITSPNQSRTYAVAVKGAAAVAPVADFTGTPLTGTGSLTTVFTDTSTNSPTSWAWTFGDTGTSTSQNPSHTYASPGVYTVTLTATNATGSGSVTKTSYVTVLATAAAAGVGIRIKTSAGWVDLVGPAVTYNASPPGSPVEGDEWVIPVGNGVLWRFRYNASGSTYKWEFLGGSPLHSDVQVGSSVETTTSTTYAALTTAGPAVVLPRAGDYMVGLGFTGGPSAVYILMSYDIGGTGAVDADAVRLQNAATATAVTSVARHRAQTFSSAVTLTAKYKGSAAGTAAYAARWLQVTPIRVS